jgi:RNA polymerase sigma factor (sigma-70 family)
MSQNEHSYQHAPEDAKYNEAELGLAGRTARFFIRSPLSPLFYFAMMLMGLLGLLMTPRQEDPQISVPMIDIFVQSPGTSAEQVANLIDRPVEEVRRMMTLNERITSIDAPLQVDPTRTIADVLADEELPDPDESLQAAETDKLLKKWVGQLAEKQQQVLQRRYGLEGAEASTLEEIASDLNLTRERVRQIQIEALDQLRRIIRRGGVTREHLF